MTRQDVGDDDYEKEALREQVEDLESSLENLFSELAEIKQNTTSRLQPKAAAIDTPTTGPHVSVNSFLASIGLSDVCVLLQTPIISNSVQYARSIVNYGAVTVGMLLLLSVKDLEGLDIKSFIGAYMLKQASEFASPPQEPVLLIPMSLMADPSSAEGATAAPRAWPQGERRGK